MPQPQNALAVAAFLGLGVAAYNKGLFTGVFQAAKDKVLWTINAMGYNEESNLRNKFKQ